jgi:hypothetical protein
MLMVIPWQRRMKSHPIHRVECVHKDTLKKKRTSMYQTLHFLGSVQKILYLMFDLILKITPFNVKAE